MVSKSRLQQHPLTRFIKAIDEQGLEALGKFYSIYRGLVYDNEDPDKLNRLQLIVPDISDEYYIPDWAHPRGQYAGVTHDGVAYGMQNLPQKGDMVWVSFEQGSLRAPVWEHGYRGEPDMPTDEDLLDKNSKWFKTPAGHGVIFNDTKDTITILHKSGKSFVIDKDGISTVSPKISLGTLGTSAEPGVLGNKNADALTKLKELIEQLNNAITQDIAASAGSPFLMFTNLATTVPQIASELAQLPQKITDTKSTHLTLD